MDKANDQRTQSRLKRILKEGLRARDADIPLACREFTSSLHRLLSTKGNCDDNRVRWFQERNTGKGGQLWRDLIGFFVSLEDSTGNVERSHGMGKRMLEAHAGPLEEAGTTYSDLLMLKHDGPKSLSELAETTPESQLRMTAMSREFLQEWRRKHGARFRVYAKKAGPLKPKAGKAIPSKQLEALARLAKKQETPSSGGTILPSLSKGAAVKLLQPGPMDSKAFRKFRMRTELIKQKNMEVIRKRHLNPSCNAFGDPKLNRGHVFTKKQRVFVPLDKQLLERKRWRVVDACTEAIPVLADPNFDVRVRRLNDGAGSFQSFSISAHLVVLDSLEVLATDRTSESPKLQLSHMFADRSTRDGFIYVLSQLTITLGLFLNA